MLSGSIKKTIQYTFCIMMAVVLTTTGVAAYSADLDDRRVRSGLRQFKSVLAADRDLARKRTIDEKLLVLLVYTDDASKAQELSTELTNKHSGGKPVTIRKMLLKTKAVHIDELTQYDKKRVAGVYLTQPLQSLGLERLVRFGISKRLVVYSPFEGDVHRGVFIGMSIGTRLHPLINIDTMKASKLRIKSFFLRVAKKYES